MRFGPLNLTWWRKRPSIHVADRPGGYRDNYIVADEFISMLDPDLATFSTMLHKLSNPGAETLTVTDKVEPGSFLMHPKGGIRRVESCRRSVNDDWFAPDEWILVVRKPWVEKPDKITYRWLEDDFMPRLA